MPFITKDEITEHIIPVFLKATTDDIPNVKFCVSRIIAKTRHLIDASVFVSQLVQPLKEMASDADKDVSYFA
jgi:hypothetical protein